ncbi:MAG: hypothetical protein WA432_00405 [Candidatus Babeliaceae bacterium]
MLDFGDNLLDYAKSTGPLINAGISGIGKGIKNTAHAVGALGYLVSHPSQIPPALQSLGQASFALYDAYFPKGLEDAMIRTFIQYAQHPEQFKNSNSIIDFVQQIDRTYWQSNQAVLGNYQQLATSLAQYYNKSSWCDLVEKGSEITTEFILQYLLCTKFAPLGRLATQELATLAVENLSKIELCKKAPAFALLAETTSLAKISLTSKMPELTKNIINFC